MEIQTLKDLKEALKDIPDEVLDHFGAGIDTEEDCDFVQLVYWDDSDNLHEAYKTNVEKHTLLKDVGKWINNIAKVQDQCEIQDELGTEEGISSDDIIEIKVKGVSGNSSHD